MLLFSKFFYVKLVNFQPNENLLLSLLIRSKLRQNQSYMFDRRQNQLLTFTIVKPNTH